MRNATSATLVRITAPLPWNGEKSMRYISGQKTYQR